MTVTTDTRVPLWRMTDKQLRAYADDDLVCWDRRQTAASILADRAVERANESEDDGA